MIAISWNCQGVGSTLIVQALKGLKRKYDGDFVFLMETNNMRQRMEKMRKKLRLRKECLWSLRG